MRRLLAREQTAVDVFAALLACAMLPAIVSTVPAPCCATIGDLQHDLGGAVFLERVLVAADLGSRIVAGEAAEALDLVATAFADYTGMDDAPSESAPLLDQDLEEVIGAGGLPAPSPPPAPTALPG